MPRLTRIYTRTGDDGSTGLGDGSRVPKTSCRIAALGDVDELNAYIGAILAADATLELRDPLRSIQNTLFHLGASLCMPGPPDGRPGPAVRQEHVAELEALMDRLSQPLGPLENFILPGGSPIAAQMHLARAVCRRAERGVLALRAQEPVPGLSAAFLNRLSDALFVMARYENHVRAQPDILWNSRA